MCEVCLLWGSVSGAPLDGPRSSFSRVRRGYCSRTSPRSIGWLASRESTRSHHVILYIHSAVYAAPMPPRQESQKFQESHEDMRYPHWLPPQVRYHESVLSCTVLRISIAPPDYQPYRSRILFQFLVFYFIFFFFFLSISLSIVLEFDPVFSMASASVWIVVRNNPIACTLLAREGALSLSITESVTYI